MKILIFSLFDTKASFFTTPFLMAHRGQAIRAVMELGQDLNTVVGRHPADFNLYEIGEFDDQTGNITTLAPQNLGPVLTFLPMVHPSLPFVEV